MASFFYLYPKLISKGSGREILYRGVMDWLGVDERGMVDWGMVSSKTCSN